MVAMAEYDWITDAIDPMNEAIPNPFEYNVVALR